MPYTIDLRLTGDAKTHGPVENAEVWKPKYGNGSTETEVRKPKCGSEKKSRLSVSSALLTHDCALLGKGWLSSSDVRVEYWHIIDSIVH